MTTLTDVREALNQGNYQTAARQLQDVLRADPSADAWYLAGELTLEKDRDRAIKHLKRALILNPRHGDTLTLLGQLGEARDFTVSDVAEEVADALENEANQIPLLRRLSRRQKFWAMGGLALLLIVLVMTIISMLFPNTAPLHIPDEAPVAAGAELLKADVVFSSFISGDLQLHEIHRVSRRETPGKHVLTFALPGAAGQLKPAQIIVYDSISALVRDSATHRQLETTAEIVAIHNALLVYDKDLQGRSIEQQLIRQFEVITGTL